MSGRSRSARCASADEAFLTSTVREVQPIAAVNGAIAAVGARARHRRARRGVPRPRRPRPRPVSRVIRPERRWITSPATTWCSVPASSRTTSAPGVGHRDRLAGELTVGTLDAYASPERDEAIAVRAARRVRRIEVATERVEQRVEQRVAVDGAARFEVARGRGRRELRGERVPVHVATRSDHERVAVGLGQDPGELAVVHDEVVGPLQVGVHARDRGDRIGQRERGGHHRVVRSLTRRARSQEDRHEQ